MSKNNNEWSQSPSNRTERAKGGSHRCPKEVAQKPAVAEEESKAMHQWSRKAHPSKDQQHNTETQRKEVVEVENRDTETQTNDATTKNKNTAQQIAKRSTQTSAIHSNHEPKKL